MKKLLLLFNALFIHYIVFAQVDRYNVVINEILADPSPVVGLPNTEFVELKNISSRPINLLKWKLDNGSTKASIAIDYILAPDSLVVLCSKTKAIFFNSKIKTIGLSSFPSLVNDGDIITIRDEHGNAIHSVEYIKKWYNNPIKAEGGWSLEMIDPTRPCDKNNWSASVHYSGGTPGFENSIYNSTGIEETIIGLQCIALNPTQLIMHFNQGADSLSLSLAANYSLGEENIHPLSALPIGPLFKDVNLTFNTAITENKLYDLNIGPINHCASLLQDTINIKTGLIKFPETNELIINEVLFDPPIEGADFVELYNNSSHVINAKDIYLSNKNETGELGKSYVTSKEDFNIFPNEYFTISTDTAFIVSHWRNTNSDNLLEMKTMPSYPDDKGQVIILTQQGKILDEFDYSDKLHFPLLREKSGVSLERINPMVPTSTSSNWHSASASSGYGTPTRKNSQQDNEDSTHSPIRILPYYFSPDNDGVDDYLTIQYNFLVPDNLMSVYVFDQNGVMVTKAIDNQLCGTTGNLFWDGLDNKKRRVSPGLYIILVESMDLKGGRLRIKKGIVVN